jgi:hypothetical protein
LIYQHINDLFLVLFRKKLGSVKPTLTDIDSAVVWMINKDLRRKVSTLFNDVKAWLKVLHTVKTKFIIEGKIK